MCVCVCVCVAEDVVKQELCKVKYLDNDLELLRNAIEDLYYFEFVIGEFGAQISRCQRSIFGISHKLQGVVSICSLTLGFIFVR